MATDKNYSDLVSILDEPMKQLMANMGSAPQELTPTEQAKLLESLGAVPHGDGTFSFSDTLSALIGTGAVFSMLLTAIALFVSYGAVFGSVFMAAGHVLRYGKILGTVAILGVPLGVTFLLFTLMKLGAFINLGFWLGIGIALIYYAVAKKVTLKRLLKRYGLTFDQLEATLSSRPKSESPKLAYETAKRLKQHGEHPSKLPFARAESME